VHLLAIDPGVRFCGWCSVEFNLVSSVFSSLASWGTLEAVDGEMPFRLKEFLEKRIDCLKILAYEKSFPPRLAAVYGRNWDATAEVRGVILSFARPPIKLMGLTARQVRAILKVGNPPRIAAVGKNQVRGMGADLRVRKAVSVFTGIPEERFVDCHQVDAVALAFVAFSRMGVEWR